MVMQISDVIGNIGKYQIIATFACFYVGSINGLVYGMVDILMPELEMFWNWDASSPNRTKFLSTQCKMEDLLMLNRSSNISRSDSSIIYMSQYSHNTLTEKLGLVCEKSWLVSLSNTLIMAGSITACFIAGILEQRYGRRLTLIYFNSLSFALWFCFMWTQNYVMFAILCFAVGCSTTLSMTVSTIQVLELFPVHTRIYFSTSIKYGILFGQLFATLFGWIFKDWFYTTMSMLIFSLISLPFPWYLCDSPLWLLAKGKTEKAKANLTLIAKRNALVDNDTLLKIDKFFGENQVSDGPPNIQEKGRFSDLFKNRIITMYTICSTAIMSIIFFIYYSLVMNAESFGHNLYEDLAISTGFSTLLLVICTILLKKISHKKILITLFLIAGVTSSLYPFFYKYSVALTILPAMTRMIISPATVIFCVYALELFPTTVRTIGIGFSTGWRFPIFLSPFTKELGLRTYIYVPFIIFAVLNFLSACFTMLLPDTRGKPLVQTVDELKRTKKAKPVASVFTINTRM